MYFDNIYNGHIHLREKIKCNKDNIWNVGSLTSISFSDSNEYIPGASILDTKTGELKAIPNPHNILFRKFKINSPTDLMKKLNELDPQYRYVLRIDVPFTLKEDVTKILEQHENIIAHRLILDRKNVVLTESAKAELEVIDQNNIKHKFIDFIKSYSDDNDKELKYPINSYINLISEL